MNSILGLGTWTQNNEETADSVYYALKDDIDLLIQHNTMVMKLELEMV